MRSAKAHQRNFAGAPKRAQKPNKGGTSDGRKSQRFRWALGRGGLEPRAAREIALLLSLAAACVAGVLLGTGISERALLAACAFLMAAHAAKKWAAHAKAAREAGFVLMDDRGIVRKQAAKSALLATWSAPFGVSLFASKSGDRALIAFTSDGATRYLGVNVPAGDEPAASTLFGRSAVHADDDALFAQSTESSLRAASAADLLTAIERREPAALERAFFSSARGESITLEPAALRVAGRDFDLRAPLEWRPFLFHEVAGQVTTIYQAIWLRQESHERTAEIALVAPLPATSDVRLSPSLADAPPSREMRVAIERLFMPLVRRALERSAARVSRTSHAPIRSAAKAKGGASSGA